MFTTISKKHPRPYVSYLCDCCVLYSVAGTVSKRAVHNHTNVFGDATKNNLHGTELNLENSWEECGHDVPFPYYLSCGMDFFLMQTINDNALS